MAGREQQRLAADDALQLPEGDNGARERDRADEHAEERLDIVDLPLDAGQRDVRAERCRDADEHGGEPDEAVEDRDELRHRRHLDTRAASSAPTATPTATMAASVRRSIGHGPNAVATTAMIIPVMP